MYAIVRNNQHISRILFHDHDLYYKVVDFRLPGKAKIYTVLGFQVKNLSI